MESKPQCVVWTFTGLYNVDLGNVAEIDLCNGFYLSKPTPFLLSARSKFDLNERQFREADHLSCYLLHREMLPLLRGPERDTKVEHFQIGLMALQIVKPLKTFGFIFQGSEDSKGGFTLETTWHRSPMNPGEWGRMRRFDAALISQVPSMIEKVRTVMSGTVAEPKNAIYLLQMALEHSNPLVTGLLSVMGLEAFFDSDNRLDFRDKLCNCLGASSLVFPDWNSPTFPALPYTVDQIAVHLYTLRSKIAHGVDLREATLDPKYPVDLLKSVQFIPESPLRPYALLLSEAAVYLLCQSIQRRI